ncbi:MAG: hypothetical protein V8Q82_00260 [Christensenellales bacterium]
MRVTNQYGLPVILPAGTEIVLRCTLARAYNYPFKKVRIFNCNFIGCTAHRQTEKSKAALPRRREPNAVSAIFCALGRYALGKFYICLAGAGRILVYMGMEKMKTVAGQYERKDKNEESVLYPHGCFAADDKRVERLCRIAWPTF